MSKRDYYEILGLTKTATEDEIKKAWRTMAAKNHPDKLVGKPEAEIKLAEERFKEAKEAYEVLANTERRREYDQFGHIDSHQRGSPFSHGNPGFKTWTFSDGGNINEVFDQIFKHHGGFGGQTKQTIQVIFLTLEEAFKGGTFIVPGTKQQAQYPAGIRSGTTFYLNDKLYRVDVHQHAKFKRSNDDLLVDLEITAIEAMIGLGITLEHLDGNQLQFTIRQGIQNGQIIKLTGKGMKNPELDRVGDLLVRVNIKMPMLTDKEKELLKSFNHRDSINI